MKKRTPKRTKKKRAASMLCSKCREAKLVRRKVEYDLGAVLALKAVHVHDMPALVCPNCEAVSIEGSLVERAGLAIAAEILKLADIEPMELRYLRRLLGDTQDEFAERLGVSRITANRWENDDKPVTGPEAYAIRSHVFFRLRDRSPLIEAVTPAFVAPPKPVARKKRLSLQGSELVAT